MFLQLSQIDGPGKDALDTVVGLPKTLNKILIMNLIILSHIYDPPKFFK